MQSHYASDFIALEGAHGADCVCMSIDIPWPQLYLKLNLILNLIPKP